MILPQFYLLQFVLYFLSLQFPAIKDPNPSQTMKHLSANTTSRSQRPFNVCLTMFFSPLLSHSLCMWPRSIVPEEKSQELPHRTAVREPVADITLALRGLKIPLDRQHLNVSMVLTRISALLELSCLGSVCASYVEGNQFSSTMASSCDG